MLQQHLKSAEIRKLSFLTHKGRNKIHNSVQVRCHGQNFHWYYNTYRAKVLLFHFPSHAIK